jgi:amidase
MPVLSALPASAQQGPFRFQEATIAGIHAALAAGQLTCTQLIRLCLDRIAAYDRQGPALHAIITVNPKAMEIAAEMDRRAGLGATIVRFDLSEYDTIVPMVNTLLFEARTVMDRYFAALGPNAPIKSFSELVAAKTSAVQKTLEAELAVAKTMADLDLDAILYPLQKILVAPVTAEEQLERNGTLSNGTGFPAVTFPGGFSAPTASAPLGVPVGAELLGLDYTEAKLLSYAYAFEQAQSLRKLPKSTPALANEP